VHERGHFVALFVHVGWFAEVNVLGDSIPVLVERIVTSAPVGGSSQIIHTVVNKAHDPLAGVFEV
jgi:hypothetical protein